jgi:peptidoglycan/LPS O-acetylase OafA/YrhL
MVRTDVDSRNRAVDLYRAISIVLVVLGHWIGAAVWVTESGALRFTNILSLSDHTHWLTWIVQVIPVFFLVGGYSNYMSRLRAGPNRVTTEPWIGARARRLMTPVGPFIVFITFLALITLALGVSDRIVHSGAWNAVVPLWFLGVYLILVAATPLTVAAWQRIRWWSVAVPVVVAVGVDLARFTTEAEWIGWANFVFVWIAVHQIGYGWADERRAPGRIVSLGVAAAGLAVTVWLTVFGPYPVSMVAVPGAPENNTLPPTVVMVTLGVFQYGLLRLFEPGARTWMQRRRPWTVVVALHTVMMTVYIWHVTALALVVLAGYGLGIGFDIESLTAWWWYSRVIWVAVLGVVLAGLVAIFGRFEHAVRSGDVGWVRLILGLGASVSAIAASTTLSLVSEDGEVLWWIVALYLIGIVGLGAVPRLRQAKEKTIPP